MINKYGDLYGAERIAELLGLDKNALDFSPVEEAKAEAASLVSWYRSEGSSPSGKDKSFVSHSSPVGQRGKYTHVFCFPTN